MPNLVTEIDGLDIHFIHVRSHYNRVDRGGHFAAWEQPQLFCKEMRASFRSLRRSS
jgi:pimeloyl-ACP methyl ester carboxylesterase